ncbi:hypothetical protein L218DRAFT_964815 [Marasmius fiardii PR-910]|nr:hypothetical protein L218DRAFT_964815 [Marasmius fiardii PR-910]
MGLGELEHPDLAITHDVEERILAISADSSGLERTVGVITYQEGAFDENMPEKFSPERSNAIGPNFSHHGCGQVPHQSSGVFGLASSLQDRPDVSIPRK